MKSLLRALTTMFLMLLLIVLSPLYLLRWLLERGLPDLSRIEAKMHGVGAVMSCVFREILGVKR